MTSKFSELLQFPCVVDFRIIVDALKQDALNEVKRHIEEILPGSVLEVTASPRVSANGKYISYTVPVRVTDAKNIDDLYQHLGKIDFIKHVL